MKISPFLFLSFLLVEALYAQDISGHWKGVIQVPMGNDLAGHAYFEQDGNQLTGYLKMIKPNKADSAQVNIEGVVENGEISFRGTSFDYGYTGACLSLHKLRFEEKGDIISLKGTWRGNWELSTCPPGVSGKLYLEKEKKLLPVYVKKETAPTNQDIISTDEYTEILTEELSKRRYYALIIGIEDYNDENIKDLDRPLKDARSIASILEAYYSFKKEDIELLSNPSRAQIIEAFDRYNEKISEKDNLLIFYAGHGIWDEKLSQGFWLPSDATSRSKAYWISNSTIRDYIGGIASKHTLLITDACFSGGIFKERSVTFQHGKAILEMYKLPSRKAMTSGTLKTVPDQSVFLDYLTKQLINNQQILLSAGELFRSFRIAVINNSQNGQVPQYGPIYQAGDEGGDFIFLKDQK